jgi:type VI secretion system protein ImpA
MPLSEAFLAPIPGDLPAGESLRYEPVYDEIKHAREEEDEIPQGDWKRERKTADYKLVVKLATQVLTERSKDLQVAAWLTEALTHRDGCAGLRDGLDLMRGLLETFWDGVHPQIDDGDLEYRVVPLEWVARYLEPAVKRIALNGEGHGFYDYEQSRTVGYEDAMEGDGERLAAREELIDEGKLAPEEFDAAVEATPKAWYKQLMSDLDESGEALDALEALSDQRFEDVAPSYRPLRGALEDVGHVARQLLALKLEQDPDPVEEPVFDTTGGDYDTSTAGASPDHAASASSGGQAVEPTSREDAAARVGAAARYLRRASPTDPAPYLLLRGFRWGELRGADEVDPRLLAAPPTQVRTRLKGLLLDGRWAELLDAAEEVMATPFGRGWLDLQRYVLTALEGLGSDYERVAASVHGALATLLLEIPSLPELTLMDDAPTANRETQQWLRDSGIFDAFSDEARDRLPSGRATKAPTGRTAFERAQERVRAGEPRKAVELLMRAAEAEGSERARFLRRSEATAIMVDAGLEAVAMPILKEMAEKIDEHTLEEWEAGDTVAQPLGLLYRCMARLEGDSHEKEELYLRVCRLDPMQAIHFSSGGDPASEPSSAEVENHDGA